MSTIKPFTGIRFQDRDISHLICPPYDVIPPEDKAQLKQRSAYNMVKIELPDAAAGRNKYQQAASLFKAWQAKGVLKADGSPAYYFYEQSFVDHGRRMIRRGFFAALRLEDPHGGSVKPHEKTLSKPKEDRRKLLRAVKANVSPIFGLFDDSRREMVEFSKKVAAREPVAVSNDTLGRAFRRSACPGRKPAAVKDTSGVIDRLWVVDREDEVRKITKALAGKKIFIADGHHRYETAWNYSQERKGRDRRPAPDAEYNYVMIFLCPMEDPGLSIWPTHRVVAPSAGWEERMERYFKVLPPGMFDKFANGSPQPLEVYYKGKVRTLVVKDRKLLAGAMPDKCTAYRDLGVSILHSLLLPDVPADRFTYVKDRLEAITLARKKDLMAVIVPSTPAKAIKEIALAGQTMPQKSTYFYPKVTTGMVIHAL